MVGWWWPQVLAAVPQQVQPDRALLGRPGDALERVPAGFDRGGGRVRRLDDLERQASQGQRGGDDLHQGSEAEAAGDEGVGDPSGPLAIAGEGVRGEPGETEQWPGRLTSFSSLKRATG